jgi:hypothetical protein
LSRKSKKNSSFDWDRLTDREFEELCFDILQKEGFTNLVWRGKQGSDRGQDITGNKIVQPLQKVTFLENYIIQCKKYVARPLSKSEVSESLIWIDAYKPNCFILMISNTLHSSTKDWIGEISKNKNYKIILYEEKDFELFFTNNKDIYDKYFRKEKTLIQNENLEALINNTLLYLSDCTEKNYKDIALYINNDKIKVNSVLKIIIKNNYITKNKYKNKIFYKLNNTENISVEIIKRLLESKYKFDILLSAYFEEFIKNHLKTYIDNKFGLNLNEESYQGIKKLLEISPSALYNIITMDNNRYKVGKNHLNELKYSDIEKQKWLNMFFNSLILELLENLLPDLHHPEVKKLLQKQKFEVYKIKIFIKIAGLESEILELESDSTIMLLKAISNIDAGQLVSTNDDTILRIGTILLNMKLYEESIGEFDLVIKSTKDKEKLIYASNNKGVALMYLEKWTEAMNVFNESLSLKSDQEIIKKKIKECLMKQNGH